MVRAVYRYGISPDEDHAPGKGLGRRSTDACAFIHRHTHTHIYIYVYI